jgi:lipoate---protein ligase
MKTPVFRGRPNKNDALFIFGARQSLPFVYSYKQDKTEIVYGPACKTENEIHLNRCLGNQIPVVKRRGGGGTVLLSPGIIVTVVVDKRNGRSPVHIFNQIHNSMISLLNELGISFVEQKGISDLAIKNKKILGSSLYLGSDPRLYYYQSSLMVKSDNSLMRHFLKYPPKEPDYRKNRSHDSFCTTIREQGFPVNINSIVAVFNKKLPLILNTK